MKKSIDWHIVASYIHNDDTKHFSFDFWNTISYSNPEFKKKRAQLIHEILDFSVELNKINTSFERVGIEYNNYQEAGGKCHSPEELLENVFIDLSVSRNQFNFYDISRKINELFLLNPPIIENDFVDVLESLANTSKTISITSNTAFIPGTIIKEFLRKKELLSYFSFCLFSDQVGYAKPTKVIFNSVYLNVKKYHSTLKIDDIIHIGDNFKTDYLGAVNFGFKSVLFNTNNELINPRYAVHCINHESNIPFDANDYSKFKFGDNLIAKKFANELFDYFIKSNLFSKLSDFKKILIYSSPFDTIPTSSYYLTHYFITSFKEYLIKESISDMEIKFSKIKRCQTYTEDYGALNAEERYNLIKNDTYKFIDLPSNNDFCIFIDDISITGTHQKIVEKTMIDDRICVPCMFLYYAKLDNSKIQPSIENKLNYSFVNGINRFTEILLTLDFKLTTRAIKYILSLERNEFDYLMNHIIKYGKFEILSKIIELSYANKYNNIQSYESNLNAINHKLIVFKQKQKITYNN